MCSLATHSECQRLYVKCSECVCSSLVNYATMRDAHTPKMRVSVFLSVCKSVLCAFNCGKHIYDIVRWLNLCQKDSYFGQHRRARMKYTCSTAHGDWYHLVVLCVPWCFVCTISIIRMHVFFKRFRRFTWNHTNMR